MIAILIDLADQYLHELTPDLRQGMKHMAGRAMKQTNDFIKACDKAFTEDSESFGATSDILREIIEERHV
jgi:hypothetical protein